MQRMLVEKALNIAIENDAPMGRTVSK